ncbi:glycogen/starch synthase [Treponema sp.]|uniref:glycogen synthase n=1 Tax=Treponema sp. TaxID=166 RepID=UPI00257DCA96|nr:glycogen/starch synthase [Treponema sp.]MBE6353939.1 glycogen synthase [Treponema sp.]
MNVFVVSREYAGIAEAGGVKNVVCSLSETLLKSGCDVTVFMPYYACTDTSSVKNLHDCSEEVTFTVAGKKESVRFSEGIINGVHIVFLHHPAFAEKQGVYTYTEQEQIENPRHLKGEGHEDVLKLNVLFQKGIVLAARKIITDSPDIIHCHDATAALVPVFVKQAQEQSAENKKYYENTKCIVTIHNAGPGYHHNFKDIREAEFLTGLSEKILSFGMNGKRIEPFLLAAGTSPLTAVSPWYADEINSGDTDTDGLSEALKAKKIKVKGIINGIDAEKYDTGNPEVSLLPYTFCPERHDLKGKYLCRKYFFENYAAKNAKKHAENETLIQYGYLDEPDDSTVCITYHGRIAHQKGIDIASKAARLILDKKLNVRFIFAGQGFPELEMQFAAIAKDYPGRAVYIKGYTKQMARLSVASADFSLHPSYFEPCGLEDFIAQLFGTIPVANATGGLKKILDEETGFLYSPNTAEKLSEVLYSLIKIRAIPETNIFTSMIAYAAKYVKENYSWKNVAEKYYLPLYTELAGDEKK